MGKIESIFGLVNGISRIKGRLKVFAHSSSIDNRVLLGDALLNGITEIHSQTRFERLTLRPYYGPGSDLQRDRFSLPGRPYFFRIFF